MLGQNSGLSAKPARAHLILRELLSLQPLEMYLPDSICTGHLNRNLLIIFKIDLMFVENAFILRV